MNVLIVSQCDKRALTETRRILDQFAERRGDRTWQTPITQAGLDTLRRLLRKTARKNTAVACHWIRGLDHSELVWVVGDASRFNADGAVPTNTTTRDVLRRDDENDWHSGEDIHLLTVLAALLHDLGKASAAFQTLLRGEAVSRNHTRHEWVSLRLFEAFVGNDDDATWLARLAAPTPADDASWLAPGRLHRDGLCSPTAPLPFKALAHAPLARAIGWLVVTHHRLPRLPRDTVFQVEGLRDVLSRMGADWNETPPEGATPDDIAPYWHFPRGLPVVCDDWRHRAARVAGRLLKLRAQPGKGDWLANPYAMHLARLCLMLADHHYSSLTDKADRITVKAPFPLWANTKPGGDFNQPLDEHLLGVAQHGGEVSRFLPRFDEHLPRLARHKFLRKRGTDERFRWQDKAADSAGAMRERSRRHGAFIVNMASTGCGKTLANARIMYALADPERGMRCAFAMGLRTLTLQTGRAFQTLLHLDDSELAIRSGGAASRVLFEHYRAGAEARGSESTQDLIDEDGHVFYEGNHDAHPLLRRVMRDPQVRKLLAAPLLVCTIDHLTPATESQRGGRQIAPMLRLMSGDLVLDEPDDFDIADLPTLTRLVHWAGLLGARVLLSSATLPPALVQGLFEAYAAGRGHCPPTRGGRPGDAATPPDICCAWFDEFHQSQADCASGAAFEAPHLAFATRRHLRLSELAKPGELGPRRRAELLPIALARLDDDRRHHAFAGLVLDATARLHAAHHTRDPRSGKRISFGLVRMANIEPLFAVALALYRRGAPEGLRIHLCVYHAQTPLLLRSATERRLDAALDRRQPDAVFALPDIRARIDAHPEADQLFIVLGSPVTEVGRDHDYDWAVVEPSSMRSLIQLAGRVRRHRDGACATPNLLVFDSNLRHFRNPQPHLPAFCRPGFESELFPLETHRLGTLLRPEEGDVIDARPRLLAATPLHASQRLTDLEHARLRDTMLPGSSTAAPPKPGQRQRPQQSAPTPKLNAATWWQLPPADALLTALLPQQQPFRHETQPKIELLLAADEDAPNGIAFMRYLKPTRRGEKPRVSADTEVTVLPPGAVQGERIAPWGDTDYAEALSQLAEELELSPAECAEKFGVVSVGDASQGWRFHPALGFAKRKD